MRLENRPGDSLSWSTGPFWRLPIGTSNVTFPVHNRTQPTLRCVQLRPCNRVWARQHTHVTRVFPPVIHHSKAQVCVIGRVLVFAPTEHGRKKSRCPPSDVGKIVVTHLQACHTMNNNCYSKREWFSFPTLDKIHFDLFS